MTNATNNASQFTTMGKEALRAACREAGISYGKLNNDGMRAALEAAYTPVTLIAPVEVDHSASNKRIAAFMLEEAAEEVADEVEQPVRNVFAQMLGNVATPAPTTQGTRVIDGRKVDPNAHKASAGSDARVVKNPAPFVPRATCKGYTIQKDREERVINGKIIRRPSEGTTCGAVWSLFDAMHESVKGLKAADLPTLADEHGWNRTNVSCEFYTWRKFNGIVGRSSK